LFYSVRKAILLLLLLPCALFSQNNSVLYSGIESYRFSNNDNALSGQETVYSEVSILSDNEKNIPTTAAEVKNTPPIADLLNFCFECGFVKWSTAKEVNCSHFLVMFSRDEKNWNILGQIYGAGNSGAMNNYKYPTDQKEVYFMIYQIDFDGNSKEYGPVFGSCKKQKNP
jgi:hypothetical protein